MKRIQNPLSNVVSHQCPSLFAPICLIWLGLLCVGCQPVLLQEDIRLPTERQPRQEPLPERFRNAEPPPVPEISWSEPPPCPNDKQPEDQNLQTVCARLLYRADTELRELIWSDAGIVSETRSLTDVPPGITSFSPDFTQLVIQTPRGHTAGGPLYLYNLKTEELRNLNEDMGLPIYSGVSALRVAGWHRDSQQLLLVNEDDEVVIWLDLVSNSYRALALGIDTGQVGPPRQFMLAPDGSGFTFVAHSRDSTGRDSTVRRDQTVTLYWYDLETDQASQLLTVPSEKGKLAATAISPRGEQLAYLVLRGGRRTGRSEELYLLDLSAEMSNSTGSLLLSGNLGPTMPVWSPNGDAIAFIRRNLTEPRRAAPDQPPPLGDIWTISIHNGEAKQRTFTEALDRPPVWSPDGNYLAFVTADGQIGMVAKEASEMMWLMESATIRAPLIRMSFVPVEKRK